MGAILGVQVLPQADHSERSEAQLRESDRAWGGLAWERVKANRGSAGPDGLSIKDTEAVLKTRWLQIRDDLLNGRYTPQPVRRVQIPSLGAVCGNWASRP